MREIMYAQEFREKYGKLRFNVSIERDGNGDEYIHLNSIESKDVFEMQPLQGDHPESHIDMLIFHKTL
jgi:hypothetical protein